jgi:cell division protein FtsW (lipid II flippase)
MANMMIMGAGFLTMLTFGVFSSSYKGSRKKTLLVIYGGIIALALFLIIYFICFLPYRMDRIKIFINPGLDSQGAGWMYTIMDNILGSAKFIGDSGNLTNFDLNGKISPVLPNTNSDFILTFVIGKFGWLFGIALIVLLGSIILRLFLASGRIRHEYGKYLCVGICCVFSLQVIVNVLMSLRLFFSSTVALPFISYGGSSYLINMALLGLFLGVYRRKDIVKHLEKNYIER